MIPNARRTVTVAALVLGAGAALAGATPAGGSAAALDRFKSLAGEWVAAEGNDMVKEGDLVARYAVTAGGSAVVETVFPGSAHEMVTVYHADGSDIVLTHYCVNGNQPRMRARDVKGTRFEFAFDGGANIEPGRDRHMHSAWLELVGADEIRNEWTEHADGKVALVVTSHLVRKGALTSTLSGKETSR